MAYLTVEQFKLHAIIPSEWVVHVDTRQPGFTLAQIEYWSDWLDTRLRKRYAAPFGPVPPNIVVGWIVRLVAHRVMLRRGIDPTDQQWQTIEADAKDARDEVKEAADGEEGLFDLPLREDDPHAQDSAIVRGGARSYSEQSPYASASRQRNIGRGEDDRGSGTGG